MGSSWGSWWISGGYESKLGGVDNIIRKYPQYIKILVLKNKLSAPKNAYSARV